MKTREELRDTNDLRTTQIWLPEWDTSLNIRQMLLEGMLAVESEPRAFMKLVNVIIAGVVNEDGSAMFSTADKEWLAQKNPAVLLRLANAIKELTPDPTQPAVLEEAVKN